MRWSVAPARIRPGVLVASVGLLVVVGGVATTLGPAHISVGQVVREVFGRFPFIADSDLSSQSRAILWQLRFPRIVLGAMVGGILALSGAAYQGVFRNPLADPYLLGVAAGAGLGATLAIGVRGSGFPAALVPLAAFAGAVVAVAITYGLGKTVGDRTATTLILAGVAVASFFTALQTYVQQRNTETLREVYSWILGRLSTTGWREVISVLPYMAVSAVVIVLHRRLLDVLTLGDAEAESLGVDASRVRLIVVAAATLGTAAAVAVGGLIGFVGIIVPHAIRLVAGWSYRVVLPLSMLFGAAFMVMADVAARTLVAPAELPIGVVTAFFGAPFFILVLRTSREAL